MSMQGTSVNVLSRCAAILCVALMFGTLALVGCRDQGARFIGGPDWSARRTPVVSGG